ncbi:MXAN_5808 family serine peptidase [Myxococcota bacterium]
MLRPARLSHVGLYYGLMRTLERVGRTAVVLLIFGVASSFALRFGTGGLWSGLEAAHAVTPPGQTPAPYDLTELIAVNETLKTIQAKYVEPSRVKPRQMFLSALNQIQQEVAQVIVLYKQGAPTVRVRVYDEEHGFRVDNVQGPWDVAARLREVFAFLQEQLRDAELDLREIEYAACNGMLRTLDPHSVFLSPDAYREMNLSTSGHFGGLGIVISMRDQMLTIMRPMPNTPAGRAGLKRLDRITKINNESTLNMPLDDAVERLRGKPNTQVTVWIRRDGPGGWQGPRPFELIREEIRIESVEARHLGKGVAYIKLSQFQSTTADELDAALADLHKKERIRALVLDLRGNPGGLLDQAAEVADRFLVKGVIVATAGGTEAREEKLASAAGTEPIYPMVVLISGSSASASEIVAGALKNQGRAALVGTTTFGKGTVQLVFPRVTPDGAALKLTIAQYLTPGDVSIQGVGVSPDIELDPMTADALEMDLYRSDSLLKERDLSKSLMGQAKRSGDRPFFKLRYHLPEAERARLRELGDLRDDEFRLDFPVRFARDLAGRLPRGSRERQLVKVKRFLEEVQAAEIAGVAADLGRLGIDWSAPPPDAPEGPRADQYDVSVRTDRQNNTVRAGEPMELEVDVANHSAQPVFQLRAITKSDGGYFDEKELVFGQIGPGETRSAKVPLGWCAVEGRRIGSTQPVPENAKRTCRIPMNAVTRQDVVRVRFFAEGGEPPRDVELRPTVQSLPQPVFAYAYQVVDDRPGNGDGQLARGEGAKMFVTVKNVGTGRAYETQANVRNLTGDGLLLHAGRFDISNLAPGQEREVVFTFDVLPQLKESFVKAELTIADRDLLVVSTEKLSLPVVRSGFSMKAASGNAQVTGGSQAPVRAQPLASTPVVGHLAAEAVVEKFGTFGQFTKIGLGAGRFGFVDSTGLSATQRPAKPEFRPFLSHSPPVVEVKTGALATREDHVLVQGVATDGDRVLDTYIFVGTRKVFYQSNAKASEPQRLEFSHSARLSPGINVITVVARENEVTATRYTRVVRRDGPQGETLPTPKQQLLNSDWAFPTED